MPADVAVYLLRRPGFSRLCLATLSAVFAGASIVYPPAWFLAFVAPAPFLFTLQAPELTPRRRDAFAVGFLFGMIVNCIASGSAWSLFPLDWFGIGNPALAFSLIGFEWVMLAMSGGVVFGILAIMLYEIRSRVSNAWGLFFVAGAVWITGEHLYGLAWSLFMLGESTTINTHFTVSSLGNALAHAQSSFWIASARWGGVPLLSFFCVAIATSIALAFRTGESVRDTCVRACVIIALFLLVSLAAAVTAEQARGESRSWGDTDALTVVVGKTDFPAELALNEGSILRRREIAYEVAEEARALGIAPDIFIMPEGTGTTLDIDGYARISDLLPAKALIIHSKYPERDGIVVQSRAHELGGETHVTEKHFTMPYGEYLPYRLVALLRTVSPETLAVATAHKRYVGGNAISLGSARDVRVGARICSEIVSPHLYRDLAARGAGLLVHTFSGGIFHGSHILKAEIRAALRLRAVENGLPIVQAANAWEADAFDCRGNELMPFLERDSFAAYRISRDDSCVGISGATEEDR